MTATERSPHMLVVDDEISILTFAKRALSDAGYDDVVASDGPQALRIVEAQRPFDLFVIDMMMPQMRGDELGRQLRQRDPDVKVLYFTGYADRLFDERQLLWEHEAFVEKPVTVKGLLEAVSLLTFGHIYGPGGELRGRHAREDSELGAHQPRAENANAHRRCP